MSIISQYNAPLASEARSKRQGWLREAVQEGRHALGLCEGYATLDADRELISRSCPELDPANVDFYRRLNLPLTKSRVSDIVSTLANLRPLWEVNTGVQQLQDSAKILNKCSWAWWRKTEADLRILSALQYSAVQRTGYLWLRYNPHFYGLNQGEMEAIPLGPKWVYYLGMPQSYDYQQAYATIICEVVPINQARADYPYFADRLKPSTDAELQSQGLIRRAYNRVVKGVDSMMDGAPPDERRDYSQGVPGVLIYHMYIRDLTMNQSGNTVVMGTPDDPKFQYTVPALGQRVPTGMVEPATSLDIYRRAQPEDTYLYPSRRYVCFTDTDILYDGPSKEFHGRAPIVKFTLDPWPWDFLGGSMVQDVRYIDDSINGRLRGIDKSAELRRRPPSMVNDEQIADSEKGDLASKIYEPEGTVKVNFREGDPIRPILPYQHYDVQAWEYEYLKTLDQQADFVSGRAAFEALARARQMPSGDTQEKFLQLTSARTTAKSRSIERSMCDLGYMVMCGVLQWWTTRKRFALFGWQGVSEKYDFDYDPGQLIPSDISIDTPEFKMDFRSSAYGSRSSRARALVKQFSLDIEPLSAHDLTSMTRQLTATRLYEGMHFPMDSWSYADIMGIDNMGAVPETDNDSKPERFLAENEIRNAAMAMMQAKSQMIMAQANPMAVVQQAIQQDPQGVLQMVLQAVQQQGGANGGGSAAGGPHNNTGRPDGRPSSWEDAPKIFNRTSEDGGQRTVIGTSNSD